MRKLPDDERSQWSANPLEEDLLTKQADEVTVDTKKSPLVHQKAKDASAKLSLLHERRVESDERWRKWFFVLFSAVLILTKGGTGVGLWALIHAHEFKGVVATGFFGSVVVQVMGLTIVIAKYFFPEGGGNTIPPESPGQINV